jgi:cell division septal protein FtsQ
MIFIVVGGLVISANTFSSSSRIDSIVVVGNCIVPDAEYFENLTIFDSPTPNVSLSQIKDEISMHQYVDAVELYHESSGQVVVEITEKEPIAILVDPSGNFDYIDNQANILEYKVFKQEHSLPLVRNAYSGEKISEKAVVGSIKLINSLKNFEEKALYEQTSEIVYNREVGGFTLIFGEKSNRIHIGSNKDIEDKLIKLAAYYKQHLIKGENDFATLDVRWANQLIVKK